MNNTSLSQSYSSVSLPLSPPAPTEEEDTFKAWFGLEVESKAEIFPS